MPDTSAADSMAGQSDIEKFAAFMRFLAPPASVKPASLGGDVLFASHRMRSMPHANPQDRI
jgi:hypothetical protein